MFPPDYAVRQALYAVDSISGRLYMLGDPTRSMVGEERVGTGHDQVSSSSLPL